MSDHVGVRLAHRGTSEGRRVRGATSQLTGTVATVGLFRRRRPPSFERLGHSGCGARLERRAEVTGIGRASVASPSRRLASHSNRRGPFVPSSRARTHSNIRVVRSVRRTAGAFHMARFGCGHRWRYHAPLHGSFGRSGSRERFVRSGLLRGAVQHANGAVAPDRLVRSCHRGARLICTVGPTERNYSLIRRRSYSA